MQTATKAATPAAVQPVEIKSPVVPQMEKEKKIISEALQERVSFTFRDAQLREEVLLGIGKMTKYNVVMEQDIKGTCTVDLKDVPLSKALEYILEPLGYTFKIEERTIYVSKPKLETRMFYLNYVALKKIGASSVVGSVGGGASSGTTGSGGETKSVEIKTETESDIWKNLEENLKNMLSKPDGNVAVNRQALLIQVTDYPKYLKNISAFLEAMEGSLHKQIMIEAKIVEVQLDDTSREGVNWQFIEGRIGEFLINAKQVYLNPTILAAPSTKSVASTPYFRLFVGNKHLNIENTFIDLLKTQGNINVVSSPRIATLNNQRAIIKVARQDVYFDEQQSNSGGVGGTLATYTPKFITVGLILDVTPQIDNNGSIVLNIHPMLTEKVGVARSPSGSEVPILDVREADTLVRVREGETVIIGGLMKDRKRASDTGTKGLMDLPLIGWLFRLKESETQKNELVVFLTPRIISTGETP